MLTKNNEGEIITEDEKVREKQTFGQKFRIGCFHIGFLIQIYRGYTSSWGKVSGSQM